MPIHLAWSCENLLIEKWQWGLLATLSHKVKSPKMTTVVRLVPSEYPELPPDSMMGSYLPQWSVRGTLNCLTEQWRDIGTKWNVTVHLFYFISSLMSQYYDHLVFSELMHFTLTVLGTEPGALC